MSNHEQVTTYECSNQLKRSFQIKDQLKINLNWRNLQPSKSQATKTIKEEFATRSTIYESKPDTYDQSEGMTSKRPNKDQNSKRPELRLQRQRKAHARGTQEKNAKTDQELHERLSSYMTFQ